MNHETFDLQIKEESDYSAEDLKAIENIKADVESHNKELRD